ncbi:hypothetical protein ABIE76_003229 [Sinorhizobium fredii]
MFERRLAPPRAAKLSALAAAGMALLFSTSQASAETVVKWLHLETVPAHLKMWEDIAAKYESEHPRRRYPDAVPGKRGFQGKTADAAAIG